jgi:xanthine dehydrogenase accessory factor
MTHDHLEDIAVCDSALRRTQLASIGLIGSKAKWSRFRKKLIAEGHTAQELERITTPIGIPGLTAKEPAVIAVSVAADLLLTFERSSH